MWIKLLKFIGVIIPKKENEFNDNCDKVIRELNCDLSAEEIYNKLSDKEVILEIHNGIVEVHKKPKGIYIKIRNFDTDGIEEEDLYWDKENQSEYYLIEYNADTEI